MTDDAMSNERHETEPTTPAVTQGDGKTQQDDTKSIDSDDDLYTATWKRAPFAEVDGDPRAFYNYDPFVFSGELAQASSPIAQLIAQLPKDLQVTQAKELYEIFLSEDTTELLKLNGHTQLRTAIMHIANTNMVKVIYGMGVTSPSALEGGEAQQFIRAFTGEASSPGAPPQVLSFPVADITHESVPSVTHEDTVALLDKANDKGNKELWPIANSAKIDMEATLSKIVPIPAYLVYDGFNGDIQVLDLYERVLNVEVDRLHGMYGHLRAFLRSCMLTHSSSKRPKPSVPPALFMKTPSPEDREWAALRFQQLTQRAAPAGQPLTTPPLPPPSAAQTPIVPDLPASWQNLFKEIFAQQANMLLSSVKATPSSTTGDEKKDETADASNNYGLAKPELDQMLRMCGKPVTGGAELLPQWIKDTAEAKLSKAFKLNIIRSHIQDSRFYPDVDVPLTTPVLEMILKRAWSGKDGATATYTNAAEGLSPFMCMDLDDEQVAQVNAASDALHLASHISVEDIKKSKKQLMAVVPDNNEDFLLLLRRFAKANDGIYTESSPNFIAMNSIPSALSQFKGAARKAITHQTRATILWIMLIQCRHFANGNTTITAEFESMQAALIAKNTSAIFHNEVPAALLAIPGAAKRKLDEVHQHYNHQGGDRVGSKAIPPNSTGSGDNPRGPNRNAWHPKLKAALEGPLVKAGHPKFTDIMNYCGKYSEAIFKKDGKMCTSNAYLGKCNLGEKCRRSHALPSDQQVATILQQLDKFISEPEGLTKSTKG